MRALTFPGPYALTFINKEKVLIKEVDYIKEAPKYKGINGSIIAKDNNYFLIKTMDSYIRLVSWESNINLKVGDRFK